MTHPLEHYNYTIPPENIRTSPLEPRDAARLFVYDTETDHVTFDTFRNISNYLPQGSLVVLNNTGVIPARVVFTKDTGGALEGLVLMNEGFQEDGTIPIIVPKQIFPGRTLSIGEHHVFSIIRQDEQKFLIRPEFDPQELPHLLELHGTTPTPYYLGKIPLTEEDLRLRYQTIFAERKRSVAAPTASLHVTPDVLESLEYKGIRTTEVTLDVGLGTFQEIEQSNLEQKTLHREPLFISEKSMTNIQEAKQKGVPVVVVGTTAVRALESVGRELLDTPPRDISRETDIFILPPFQFNITDMLVTNFHVPRSSLMALVDAFLKNKKAKRGILELYDLAIREGFQFYSFGDSMLIK